MSILSGPWNRKRAKSFAYLAVAFWRRQLRRLVGLGRRDEGGVQRFLDNYAGEGMAPLTQETEERLRRMGACIQCGLCEAMGPSALDRVPAWTRAIALQGPSPTQIDPTDTALCPVGPLLVRSRNTPG